MNSPRFDLVILDWDGTVVDSTAIIIDGIISAAKGMGIKAPPRDLILRAIGLGIDQLLLKLFPYLSYELLKKVAEGYRTYYSKHASNSYLFDGVKEGIEKLYQNNYKLAVATGKSRKGLNFDMQNTELIEFFLSTKTVDECFSKPHPQMVETILKETQTSPDRAVMVGDTYYDLEMGNNAQIQTIAVTYGAQPKDLLMSFKPLACFDSFQEVVNFILL